MNPDKAPAGISMCLFIRKCNGRRPPGTDSSLTPPPSAQTSASERIKDSQMLDVCICPKEKWNLEHNVKVGIIGGSGLYSMSGFEAEEEIRLETPFGEPSDAYIVGTLDGQKVAFLARHGRGHRINPSELNYRANIYGMKMLGRGAHPLRQRRRFAEGRTQAARFRSARPVL